MFCKPLLGVFFLKFETCQFQCRKESFDHWRILESDRSIHHHASATNFKVETTMAKWDRRPLFLGSSTSNRKVWYAFRRHSISFLKKFLCPAVQIYALQREDWTASFRFGYCQKLLSLNRASFWNDRGSSFDLFLTSSTILQISLLHSIGSFWYGDFSECPSSQEKLPGIWSSELFSEEAHWKLLVALLI